MRKIEWLILGGGVTGLAAAGFLQEAGKQWTLLERCPTLGGLTRTIEIDRFCFNYTGYFLHLNRYSKPSEIPYAQQDDRDWKLDFTPRELLITIKEVLATPVSTLKPIPSMWRMPLELRRSLSRDLRSMPKQVE